MGKNVGEKNNVVSFSWEGGLKSNSGLSHLTFLPSLMFIKIKRCRFLKTIVLIRRFPNSRERLVRLDSLGVQIHALQLLSLPN